MLENSSVGLEKLFEAISYLGKSVKKFHQCKKKQKNSGHRQNLVYIMIFP